MINILQTIMANAIANDIESDESEITEIYRQKHGNTIQGCYFCFYQARILNDFFVVEIGKEKYKVAIERIV